MLDFWLKIASPKSLVQNTVRTSGSCLRPIVIFAFLYKSTYYEKCAFSNIYMSMLKQQKLH